MATTTANSVTAAPASKVSWFRLVLWAFALLGVGIIFIRLRSGLGAVSNMTDAYTWGFGIGHKLSAVASAAGAFTVCSVIYIFNLERFRPLVRPAILIGFLGYLMFIFMLVIDLGRPERIWHMLIFWNFHSPLFEVGMCVMFYTTVLLLEFLPLPLEKLGWNRALHAIHSFTLPLVIFGVVLSTLHQSSLGTLFLVADTKIHALWQTPLIPLYFFVSALFTGFSFVTAEGWIRSRIYGRPYQINLLKDLAKALPWLLGLYLVLKFGELAYAGDLHHLWKVDLYSVLYWTELGVGVLVPMVLFSFRAVRENKVWLVTTAFIVIAGTSLGRFNLSLIAWPNRSGYTPHWMELALSAGTLAVFALTYDWVARNLPLFADENAKEGAKHA